MEKQLKALKLYLVDMGVRAIGRVLNVNNVTGLNWIRNFGQTVKAYVDKNMPDNIQDIDIVEIHDHTILSSSLCFIFSQPGITESRSL